MKKTSPYGSWKSPFTAEELVKKSDSLAGVQVNSKGKVFIVETRPQDKGRTVLCELVDGKKIDITPSPLNIRNRVHEYGGGSCKIHGTTVYFSEFTDQRIYTQKLGEHPTPLTPEKKWRFGSYEIDATRNVIFAVRENHEIEEQEAQNSIVKISIDSGEVSEVVSGYDFYDYPKLSPDGKKLAYICWKHPQMPWDGNELWVANLDNNGQVISQKLITGGEEESVYQPEWNHDGSLYYVTDKTGWWNLYRNNFEKEENIFPTQAEFGSPQWSLGGKTYLVLDSERVLCTFNTNGIWKIALIKVNTGEKRIFETEFTSFVSMNHHKENIWMLAASPTCLRTLVKLNLDTGKFEKVYCPTSISVDKKFISEPKAIEFPTENGLTAHAFYYPPKNPDFTGPDNELPPLIVMSHGGPTTATNNLFKKDYQFWTTRGFAIIDVNYGGSSGYGRKYRQRLNGNWGIVDIHDCENAAKYLINKRLADKNRIAIRGGSAGGYTTLCALTFLDSFHAGASYFGISDLDALLKDTHKFESRYPDSLIGPYPEKKQTYFERSPINFVNKLSCPIIFFQGLKDKVVPPNQAEMMYKILLEKKLPTAYIKFPEEAHGFRKAENMKKSLETELYFYSRVFKFKPADNLPEVEIKNLD